MAMNLQKKCGFTLAEVLITLGVVGVIAAITVPSLIQKHQEQVTVTSLKKVYSVLSQAYVSAVQENGTPDNWDIVAYNSPVGAKNILDKLSLYLNLQKNCGTGPGCFPDLYYQRLMGGNWANLETDSSNLGLNRAILADGTLIYIQVRDEDCLEGAGTETSLALQNVCAYIGVDVNGFKKPNRWGYDLFSLKLTKYGIVPRGSALDINSTFSSNCRNKTTQQGWACAGWVIYNENMDYLHCNDLAWDGKHKCSD